MPATEPLDKRRKTMPYFRYGYAMWLKGILDTFKSAGGKSLVLDATQYKMRASSLYVRVNQAWLYLNEYHDPTGIYLELRHSVMVKKDGAELRFVWKQSFQVKRSEEKFFTLEETREIRPEIAWKRDLETFIEITDTEGAIFSRDDVMVTQDDHDFVINLCLSTEDFAVVSITKTSVKVVCSRTIAFHWRNSVLNTGVEE